MKPNWPLLALSLGAFGIGTTEFAPMKARAAAAVQTALVEQQPHAENPRVILALARARMQLRKIAAELNFLGMGTHIPPFAFEHLQNLARYFAQHAAQVEQAYIQFKSSAENETLREQQMAQQASLAAASVEVDRLSIHTPDLDDVFLALTGQPPAARPAAAQPAAAQPASPHRPGRPDAPPPEARAQKASSR